jgi:chromosome segregation ATPase
MDKQTRDLIETHLFYIRESMSDLKNTNVAILNRLTSQEEVLLRNTITVEDHKRRSNLLEQNQAEFVKTLKDISDSFKRLSTTVNQIESELQPIKTHVRSVERFVKFLIVLNDNKGTIAKILAFMITISVSTYFGVIELKGIFK